MRAELRVSHEKVGLLVVVSHPLKLTALAVDAVVAVLALPVIPIHQVPEAHTHVDVA